MKKIMIIALAFGVFACGNSKEVADSNTSTTETVTETVEGMVSGVVKDLTATNGCDFVIVVTVSGNELNLEPLALDQKYKVDGKAVKLIYTPSRRMSKCESANTMPITIDKITE